MVTQSTPLVSLQTPKDVSLAEIEAELGRIWQSYNATSDSKLSPLATRASTFSLVVYEPEETQQLLATLGFYTGPVDGIGGPRTDAAIRTAQAGLGLAVTGKADEELLAKLREAYLHRSGNGIVDNAAANAQYAVDARGAGVADAIASQNPCRIIALMPTHGEDEGVTAQVSAYCPIQKQSRSSLICCEYITLKGTEAALERVSSMVSSLLIAELPKFLWWKATPTPEQDLFQKLVRSSNCVIVDSSTFLTPETDLQTAIDLLLNQGINVADLNWRRLAPWQELTAEAFDPPERRSALTEVDQVTIDYEKGNSTQALMFLGWLASRLQWQPVAISRETGDYDIMKIQLVAADQRPITAELAGVPMGDPGEILGDLTGLRLTSTNLNANCCTILCSETTGCMRMEAGGGAQACRVEQVTSLADQKQETLLGEQLHRWGREMLYEESMTVVAEILHLDA